MLNVTSVSEASAQILRLILSISVVISFILIQQCFHQFMHLSRQVN